jgi:uncharacterized coiled-coil protein SlyX
MQGWVRVGALIIGLAGGPALVLAQDARMPGLQAPPSSLSAPGGAAAGVPPMRRTEMPAPQTVPPPAQPPARGGAAPSAAPSQGTATAALPVEERIARLESALAKANARIADLETRMRTHTHSMEQLSVGLLVEKLNGRDVPLAIGPRRYKGSTGPATP